MKKKKYQISILKWALFIQVLIINKYLYMDKTETMTIQSSSNVKSQIKRGHWNRKQKRAFVMGLKKYGIDWKKIKTLIPSRTLIQIRSHAQKFFERIQNQRYDSDDEEANEIFNRSLRLQKQQDIFFKNQKQHTSDSSGQTSSLEMPKTLNGQENKIQKGQDQTRQIETGKHIILPKTTKLRNSDNINGQNNAKNASDNKLSLQNYLEGPSFFYQIAKLHYNEIINGNFFCFVDMPTDEKYASLTKL